MKGLIYTRLIYAEQRRGDERASVTNTCWVLDLHTDHVDFPDLARLSHIIIALGVTLPYKHSLYVCHLLNLGTVPGAKHIGGKIGFRHADATEAIQLLPEIALPVVTAARMRVVVSTAIQAEQGKKGIARMDEIAGNGMAKLRHRLKGKVTFSTVCKEFASVDLLLCLECLAAEDELGRGRFR